MHAVQSIPDPSISISGPRKKYEEILREVATVISESHTDVMKRLGKEMGFKSKDIKKYRKANRAEDEAKSEGALEMLQSWSKDVPRIGCQQI